MSRKIFGVADSQKYAKTVLKRHTFGILLTQPGVAGLWAELSAGRVENCGVGAGRNTNRVRTGSASAEAGLGPLPGEIVDPSPVRLHQRRHRTNRWPPPFRPPRGLPPLGLRLTLNPDRVG
jgi:hypothetical protein